MDKQYQKQLVDFFNQLMTVSEEELSPVFPLIHQKSVKRGILIKNPGDVDTNSRFLCSGFIGLYKEEKGKQNLEHIFGKGDVVREYHSYYSGNRMDYYLKSITEVVFLEMSVPDQKTMLDTHPILMELNGKMMHFIIQRRAKVSGVRILGLKNGYPELLKVLPGIGSFLDRKELAAFFNCSTSKVARWKKELGKS